MEGCGTVLSLGEFIRRLDHTSLPCILQVCSGIYFQGSVYELSGCEVCLSTGDLLKIISLELLSVRCEDIRNNCVFELPLDHSGLFKIIPEYLPYNTVEELLGLMPFGEATSGSFTFTCRNELIIDKFTCAAGQAITFLSVEEAEKGEKHARCQIKRQNTVFGEVLIPFSYQGEFYECESDHGYSVQEIISSPRLCSRHFCKSKSQKGGDPLVFSPIYQIEAIMHLRNNIVKFPSSLEVDVVDVTAKSQDFKFITPLTLAEVMDKPKETFPLMVEILEGPQSTCFFHYSWFAELQKGRHLVLHKQGESAFVLASTLRGRKAQQYFLISKSYGGRMKRRPREFSSVYELYTAFLRSPRLQVCATRHSEADEEEGIPELNAGELLEVQRLDTVKLPKTTERVEALVCRRQVEEEEDEEEERQEEESDEVYLPLFMVGHFVEKHADNKKYLVQDLGKSSSLPLDVKLVTRDADMEKDPLVGLSSIRLEETLMEPTVLASLPGKAERCFELLTRWLKMSVSSTSDSLPWPDNQPPKLLLEGVTEVTESFYFEIHKISGRNEAPPPRPPKRRPFQSKPSCASETSHAKSSVLLTQLSNLTVQNAKGSPLPLPPRSTKQGSIQTVIMNMKK